MRCEDGNVCPFSTFSNHLASSLRFPFKDNLYQAGDGQARARGQELTDLAVEDHDAVVEVMVLQNGRTVQHGQRGRHSATRNVAHCSTKAIPYDAMVNNI